MKKLLVTILVATLLATSLVPAKSAEAATMADFNTEVETRYNNIMASVRSRAVDGVCEVDYVTGWYEALDPLEVAARLIYGEAPWWIPDKKCVAMVLWNRREKSWYPDTLYDVAVDPGQFAAITGNAGETETARNVYVNTSSWENALRYACIIWTARVLTVEPDAYLGIPDGFVDQMFFLSYDGFFGNAYDSGGVSKLSTSEGQVVISDIFIPVHGACTSVAQAECKYNKTENASLGRPYNAPGERVNIYYSR